MWQSASGKRQTAVLSQRNVPTLDRRLFILTTISRVLRHSPGCPMAFGAIHIFGISLSVTLHDAVASRYLHLRYAKAIRFKTL